MYTYVIGELMDNIYQHSEFTYASVMAQKYGKKGFIELCFFDNGITIPGSFAKHGKAYPKDGHAKAIYDAISGKSTEADVGRGFGLSTNVDMFRDIGGEVLIVSGNGAVYVNKLGLASY